MSTSQDPGSSANDSIRKRTCSACERCRLKKSKCDGLSPCSRCIAVDSICNFKKAKRPHDRVYPRGYVEMLENQQAQLITGLQALYNRLRAANEWIGPSPKENSDGTALTHDILEKLGVLTQEENSTPEPFEEKLAHLDWKLVANGTGSLPLGRISDSVSGAYKHPKTEQTPQEKFTILSDPLVDASFPLRPPLAAPRLQLFQAASPLEEQYLAIPFQSYDQLAWHSTSSLSEVFESGSVSYDAVINYADYDTGLSVVPGMAINPCMTMKS